MGYPKKQLAKVNLVIKQNGFAVLFRVVPPILVSPLEDNPLLSLRKAEYYEVAKLGRQGNPCEKTM